MKVKKNNLFTVAMTGRALYTILSRNLVIMLKDINFCFGSTFYNNEASQVSLLYMNIRGDGTPDLLKQSERALPLLSS